MKAIIKVIERENRTPVLISQLVEVWERSVRESHLFLSDGEILQIKEYVPQALYGVSHLLVAESEDGCLTGFMGIEGERLEMLFLDPSVRSRGLGSRFLQRALTGYGVREVTVNEQNPQAVGFYEHMGFKIYKRTEKDEQGGPYPLLYMLHRC